MLQELERAAGVIVVRETPRRGHHYLLLHHTSGGHWYFPKGHLEPGELPKNAALRELSEETGIRQVELIDGFVERIEYGLPPPRGRKEVLFYLGRTQQETIRLSAEHDAYAWLSYHEARARLTYQDTRQLLDRAEAFLKRVLGE
jgi:8-oxo-dGTP pyrophosphatase MutT (NUDIX family)